VETAMGRSNGFIQAHNHFLGSIVTMPTKSVPEGVTKYLLIDGQQRLTTLFILLALIRDINKKKQEDKILSDEIHKTIDGFTKLYQNLYAFRF
jgi:uncharacterized protein with ParB-like and HNH nuclease domain